MDNSKSQSEQITLTEHLSALVDDEVGSFEQRRVLDELSSNAVLRQKLSSYSLIGETMRSENMQSVTIAGSDFLASIHDQINDEQVYHHVELESQKTQSTKSWLRPIGGFAMAASVAAIAVLGFQNYQLQSNQQTLPSLASNAQGTIVASQPKTQLTTAQMKAAKSVSAADATDIVAANDIQSDTVKKVDNAVEYQQADAKTRSYLKRYVDSHMQYAPRAFVPSVRVIAYAD